MLDRNGCAQPDGTSIGRGRSNTQTLSGIRGWSRRCLGLQPIIDRVAVIAVRLLPSSSRRCRRCPKAAESAVLLTPNACELEDETQRGGDGDRRYSPERRAAVGLEMSEDRFVPRPLVEHSHKPSPTSAAAVSHPPLACNVFRCLLVRSPSKSTLRPPRRVSKRKAWIYGHGNRPSGHSKITSKTIATTTKVSATATTVRRTSFAFLCGIVRISLRTVDPLRYWPASQLFGTGFRIPASASLLSAPARIAPENTGMRSCISTAKSFGSVMIIVHDLSRSPVCRSFHSSQRPAAARSGKPSASVKYHGCFPAGVFCHS